MARSEHHLEELVARLDADLAEADRDLERRFPGERAERQPVHTVYVPADAHHEGLLAEWGEAAAGLLAEHAPTPAALAELFGLPLPLAEQVHERVAAKLRTEPVEDLRVDFEDGFGDRPDDEEDAAATRAAATLARTRSAGTAAPYHGIRFKSLEAATRRRGLRTLDLVVGGLAAAGGPAAVEGFVVTLPKVTSVAQVEAMVTALAALEEAHRLPSGSLRFEIQVETPQAVLGPDGTALVARMIHAARGRCSGLHYGTYDYSASCGIGAAYQSMEHPAADHAKAVMQVAAAGTGVFLSDGSTNVLPVGGREQVVAAWRLHARLVRRSLERGYHQGWDLHPGQLPSRFVATYAFHREGLTVATARLRAFVHGGDSGYLDEPATAAALAGGVLRGLECGAVEEAEVVSLVGVDRTALARLARRTTA